MEKALSKNRGVFGRIKMSMAGFVAYDSSLKPGGTAGDTNMIPYAFLDIVSSNAQARAKSAPVDIPTRTRKCKIFSPNYTHVE
jgi:hypothetical protein